MKRTKTELEQYSQQLEGRARALSLAREVDRLANERRLTPLGVAVGVVIGLFSFYLLLGAIDALAYLVTSLAPLKGWWI